ncbi:SIP domain-containing protein [Micrococcus luteus]|nr:SIP domain-containing protein [Micrococcus luteus]MCV7721094.1 SIP domain-containing protein [Micrococcus luteus]
MTSSAVLIRLPGWALVMFDPAAQGRTPRGGPMDVVLEVPGRDHVPALDVPEGATLTVLHRGDAVPGALLTPHLGDLPAAPRDHVWACGEQSLATAARRVIVRRDIAPKRAIMFSGYWRVDGPRL